MKNVNISPHCLKCTFCQGVLKSRRKNHVEKSSKTASARLNIFNNHRRDAVHPRPKLHARRSTSSSKRNERCAAIFRRKTLLQTPRRCCTYLGDHELEDAEAFYRDFRRAFRLPEHERVGHADHGPPYVHAVAQLKPVRVVPVWRSKIRTKPRVNAQRRRGTERDRARARDT